MGKHFDAEAQTKPICGIIMPISAMPNYPKEHWIDVRSILDDAITLAGFIPNLVSDTNEVAVIQRTIVQNIYNNDIIVCDVSGKNPNVMLELGMRLTFDKPIIIVKDDETKYDFDISPVEHLEYRKDFKPTEINAFKSRLIGKLKSSYEKRNNRNYPSFLKTFGIVTFPKLEHIEVEPINYLVEQIKFISDQVYAVKVEQEIKYKREYSGEYGNSYDEFLDELKIFIASRKSQIEEYRPKPKKLLNDLALGFMLEQGNNLYTDSLVIWHLNFMLQLVPDDQARNMKTSYDSDDSEIEPII